MTFQGPQLTYHNDIETVKHKEDAKVRNIDQHPCMSVSYLVGGCVGALMAGLFKILLLVHQC